jgi:hypothetical protein
MKTAALASLTLVGLWLMVAFRPPKAALLTAAGGATGRPAADASAGPPRVGVETDASRPDVVFLSWDTEGGQKAQINLLREGAGIGLKIKAANEWTAGKLIDRRRERDTTRFRLEADGALVNWEIRTREGRLDLRWQAVKNRWEAAEVIFPFDPRTTPATVLPGSWGDDGTFALPAVINAPDFGPMLVRESGERPVSGRLEGSREKKTVDLVLTLPQVAAGRPVELSFSPLILPSPAGLKDHGLWGSARRGWLNAFQPCARWGDQSSPFSAPPGILGNNVISDPASCSVWFYADQALWLPRLARGVSLAPLVRRTIDYWLDKRMRRDDQGALTGEVTCYWDYGNFLDANASPLIAAWDYVEMTSDLAWLRAASRGSSSWRIFLSAGTSTATAWSRPSRAATAARSPSPTGPAPGGTP